MFTANTKHSLDLQESKLSVPKSPKPTLLFLIKAVPATYTNSHRWTIDFCKNVGGTAQTDYRMDILFKSLGGIKGVYNGMLGTHTVR